MSHRKDRERFLTRKQANPDYQGFRGYGEDANQTDATPLQGLTCSICGRRRNVAVDTAEEQADNFVCLSCREEMEKEAHQEGVSG